jgi:hypothetical protein
VTPCKAVRTRKVRWTGPCPLCRSAITTGQLVASENRRPWVHAACLLASRKAEEPFSGEDCVPGALTQR